MLHAWHFALFLQMISCLPLMVSGLELRRQRKHRFGIISGRFARDATVVQQAKNIVAAPFSTALGGVSRSFRV